MNVLDGLQQGSAEWLKVRLSHFTASEAPAMLGLSSYMTRTELLELKKTGIAKEVDAGTQARFNKGHETEELARPIAEQIINDEFYPITGSKVINDIPLLASFDGLTMLEDVIFEHKLINAKLKTSLSAGIIPEQYEPQLEQQLMVSGAEKVLFMASDGTLSNSVHTWYFSDDALRNKILAGWKQFAIDLESFEVTPKEVKPETKKLMEIPALSIVINGEVSSSNMEVYKSTALQFIESINTNLQTDDDFAQAEVTIRFCDGAEKELKAVKKQALSQTADIDLLFKTVDHLSEELRHKRLTLNKLVKSQKENIKRDIVVNANKLIAWHLLKLHGSLNGLKIPVFDVDFHGSIKGKRNIASMRDAIETELARAKIEANQISDLMRANINLLDSFEGVYKFLFNDLQNIITKDEESFKAIVNTRITQHKESEIKRIEVEREKIRIEEQQKAEREERQKLENERIAIRQQEQEKARIEAKETRKTKASKELERIEKENIEIAKQREEHKENAVKLKNKGEGDFNELKNAHENNKNLVTRITIHLRDMAPHAKERVTAVLLQEALNELKAL